MKKLLSACILSLILLTGCDTFNKEPSETPPEPFEAIIKVIPEEDTTLIVEESETPLEAPVKVIEKELLPSEKSVIKIHTIGVTSKQLGLDYSIDSYRANKLYKDKALTITGEVVNIFISSSSDKAIVFLKTEDDQIPVMASGEFSFAAVVKDLKIKDTVVLLCQGTESISKAPQVNKCIVL